MYCNHGVRIEKGELVERVIFNIVWIFRKSNGEVLENKIFLLDGDTLFVW